VVVDAGNSAWKWVAFDGAGAVVRNEVRPAVDGTAPEWALHPEALLIGCAVASGAADALDRSTAGRIRLLGRDFPCAVPNATRIPGETGLDRLAAALAAGARARGTAIAVGVGTAVTVDVLDAAGAFRGGAIAPGMESASRGLAAAAPRLVARTLQVGGTVSYPGTSTADALDAGLLLGWAGLIDRLVDEARRSFAHEAIPGGEVPVFLSGGHAPLLAPFLRCDFIPVEHLVAEGVRLLHTVGSQKGLL
jgi:type III pantothenate kinase